MRGSAIFLYFQRALYLERIGGGHVEINLIQIVVAPGRLGVPFILFQTAYSAKKVS